MDLCCISDVCAVHLFFRHIDDAYCVIYCTVTNQCTYFLTTNGTIQQHSLEYISLLLPVLRIQF